MARIGDAGYLARLVEILQTRDPINLPEEVFSEGVGIVVSIDAALLLAKARRRAAAQGLVLSVTQANPAAGAEWTHEVPTGKAWNFVSFTARLVTSATVATRIPRIIMEVPDRGGTLRQVGVIPAGFTQLASLTHDYTWARGINTRQSAGSLLEFGIDAPNTIVAMPAGSKIRSITGNIQVGDQWSAVVALIEEYDLSQ